MSQVRFVDADVVGPGMLIANQFESLISPTQELGQKLSAEGGRNSQSLLVGHKPSTIIESNEDFVLPEFYTNKGNDELDSVFSEWGS